MTSRNIKDRLEKELLTNVSIRVEQGSGADSFTVPGRGELQLGILVETMRREGYEMQCRIPRSSPRPRTLSEGAVELCVIDVPDTYIGVVTRADRTARGARCRR